MAKNETKTAVVTIRIRPSVKRLAEKLAKQERRSVANFIEVLIEQAASGAKHKAGA
jgi:predicted HicB family RNase H-like nuclease